MARKYIARSLSGGVVVLCVILLFTPNSHSQGFKAVRKTFVLSGSVGLPGVTMQGLTGPSGPPVTDENGVYSAEVVYGWSGAVTPVKLGYTFEPKQRVYQKVTENKSDESYSANLLTYKISGSTGQAGVKLTGLPDDPVSDENGRYTATLTYGWSGPVIPEKTGYRFEPPSKMYTQIIENKSGEDFKAVELTFTIAGSVGADGVVMKGLPNNPVTSGDGNYRVEVPYGWSGTVTPTKEGHQFSPPSREYSLVMDATTFESYTAEVFTYRISGSVGMSGVTMDGLPDNPMTGADGYYSAVVPYGWLGKVTPSRPGYEFAPPSRDFKKVISDHESQDFNPGLIQLMISGNAGIPGATMEGLSDNPVSDATGAYRAKVEWGWGGTVTPVKEGMSFEPPSRTYASLANDQLNQTYAAKPITYRLAGNVGPAQVLLDGLPGRVLSEPDGSYSVEVTYKWNGNVTPKKAGYEFEPPSRSYVDVQADQTIEDYQARIIQYTISGRIADENGSIGIAGVLVFAENNGGSDLTDANGDYQLPVDFGWRGKLTPNKDGYTFTPVSKMIESVVRNTSSVGFLGKAKMMTITDSIIFGEGAEAEPITGVTVTADPGGYTGTTDSKGKYAVKVPYGWSGRLVPTKEGFGFEETQDGSNLYTSVTEDIDKTVKPVPSQPVPSQPVPSQPLPVPSQPVPSQLVPSQPVPLQPLPSQPVPSQPVDPERQALLDLIEKYDRQLRILSGEPVPETPGLPPAQPGQIPAPLVVTGPAVNGDFQGDLLDVLIKISEQTNVDIGVDRTVKAGVQPVNVRLVHTPIETALQSILGTQYSFKKEGDAYLVFRPITNTFMGDQLRQVLQDIALAAGVPIIPDENVIGEVWVELPGVSLKVALDIVLAGTGYVVKETPNYILVASRDVTHSAFPDISEMRNVRLNYLSPLKASQLLSTAYEKYVRSDNDPNGHIISVTAPPALADQIVRQIRSLDHRPRQVLLDARVVVMERGDLLDMGVEWGFPTMSAGVFSDSYLDGDKLAGSVGTSWPWGVQIGYSSDRSFTNSLLMALNLLQENGQADIVSNPQVLAQDGKESNMGVVTEEHFVLTAPQTTGFFLNSEFVTITSGTTLTITPHIGDNNDITLEMEVEVSDSIPNGRGTDLPVVTRRRTKNVATIADGGTVALAGLTENRSRLKEKSVPYLSNLPLVGALFRNTESDQSTQEVAVFVTAQLIPDQYKAPTPAARLNPSANLPTEPAGEDYREQLRQSLSGQLR